MRWLATLWLGHLAGVSCLQSLEAGSSLFQVTRSANSPPLHTATRARRETPSQAALRRQALDAAQREKQQQQEQLFFEQRKAFFEQAWALESAFSQRDAVPAVPDKPPPSSASAKRLAELREKLALRASSSATSATTKGFVTPTATAKALTTKGVVTPPTAAAKASQSATPSVTPSAKPADAAADVVVEVKAAPPASPALMAAFTSRRKQEELDEDKQAFLEKREAFFEEAWAESEARLKREVNRLTHPEVPFRLVFEGVALPAVLPGTATTDALPALAEQLHNLEPRQRLRFNLNGTTPLQLGLPISESPLANTRNLEVFIHASQAMAIAVKSNRAQSGGMIVGGGSWWESCGTASGHRGTRTTRARNTEHEEAAKALATPEGRLEAMKSRINKIAAHGQSGAELMERHGKSGEIEFRFASDGYVTEAQRKPHAQRVELLDAKPKRNFGPHF